MLLCLGFGTQFSTTETVVTIIQDEFPHLRGRNRKWLLLAVCTFMFMMGMSMITQGGLYVLQLVDNHAATYSALILGCTEVSVMAWIYGADCFLDNLKQMLGFYPYPYIFWKWAWKVIAPSIVSLILIFTIIKYSGNVYGDYEFPMWANTIGWMITFSSVICVPIVAIYKIFYEQGSLWTRIQNLSKPSYDWGPACSTNKHLAGYREGETFDNNIGQSRGLRNESSNVTLITNISSSTNLLSVSGSNSRIFSEIRDANTFPLSEIYEEEEIFGSDSGLNMHEICREQNPITVAKSDWKR